MAERADAARNRQAVLAAAAELVERDGGDRVTLAAVAAAAGVGKATVVRRFGDLGGLIEAALAPRVSELRHAIRNGPSPLGPGGDPRLRLHTYIDALFDFVLANRALIRALEHRGPHAYYANPASKYWINELDRRIRAVHPDSDAAYLAYVLFTSMRADVLDYLRQQQRITIKRMREGLHDLADPQRERYFRERYV